MNSVNWIGKALGCMLFEPFVARLGYKKLMFMILALQFIGVIGESSPQQTSLTVSRAVRQGLDRLLGRTGLCLPRCRFHRECLPGLRGRGHSCTSTRVRCGLLDLACEYFALGPAILADNIRLPSVTSGAVSCRERSNTRLAALDG